MLICLNCGTPNPPDALQCESCGLDLTGGPSAPPLLPSNEEASTGAGATPTSSAHVDDITSRYDQFAKTVEALRLGTVTPAQFIDWLSEARVEMETRRNLFIEAVDASGDDDDGKAQVQEALEGILDFEEAIEEMWAFTLGQTGVEGLDSALATMWRANARINEAMRNNRQYRASLEDDWGFM